ncbi:MAG: Gfo/Idh/MocA family oxidoreductase [Candidatus Thiodiazotropha sp.]
MLDSGRIGQLKRLTSRFDRFRPEVRNRWREQPGDGSGILWVLGPHLLDQVVMLLGQPDSIQSRLGCLRDGARVVDNFDLWLDYGDCKVTLGSSSFQAGPNQRFLLEVTKGSYVKYGEVPVHLDEAVWVIRLIEMAIKSHEQGRKLIL